MEITRLSIRRPLLVLVVFLTLALVGVLGYTRLGVDLMPRMNLPVVTVVVPYPGAGPEEVASQVTKPVEDAVSGAEGLKSVSSVSSENLSTVIAEFQDHVRVEDAAGDVQRRVAAIRGQLPEGVREPSIIKADVNALPIIELALVGGDDPARLFALADRELRQRLESIPGVASVSVVGGREREVRVEFDPDRLWAYQVPIQQLTESIRAGNLRVPAGTLTWQDRQEVLRFDAEVSRPDELLDIPVGVTPAGGTVRVRDVATVVEAYKDVRQIYRLNGQEGVGIVITKQPDANTVDLAARVREVVGDVQGTLPPGASLQVVADSSTFIRHSVDDVQRELALAVVVTGLILLLFLHTWRSTVIVLLAIPTSLVTTFGIMWLLGFSVNIVTLLALTLTIGILVDDSIVVLENIIHHLRQGKEPRQAALDGRSEIGLAAIAITLVDVIVFLPIALTSGLVGSIFREFGLTVAAATLVSLFVSFTLTPMLASRWLRMSTAPGRSRWDRFVAAWERGYAYLEQWYTRVLAGALRWRGGVLAVTALLLAGSVALIPLGWIGQELVPGVDQNEMTVYVELPPGSSVQATSEALRAIESHLAKLPEVERYTASVGVGSSVAHALLAQSQGEARFGTVRVVLKPRAERRRGVEDVARELRRFGQTLPGMKVRVQTPIVGLATAQPFSVRIEGPDAETVNRLALELERIVRTTPGAVDVSSTVADGATELRIRPDPGRSADLAIPQALAGMALRTAYEGEVVSTFRPDGGEELDVRVRARPEFREAGRVLDLPVLSPKAGLVRLSDLARQEVVPAPGDVRRQNRMYQATVSAGVEGRDLGALTADVMARARSLALPPGYRLVTTGQTQEMGESFRALGLTLVVSILLTYLLLVALYDSLIYPFVTLFSVPVAGVGALAALALTGRSLNILSLIGLIMLAGLATKNGILLVDYTQALRREGVSRDEALLTAGPRRLRPILMTSLSVAIAMLPVAIGIGSGSELRQPMAITVIGGVVSSTVLTLVVVPAVYTVVDDLQRQVARLADRLRRRVVLAEGRVSGD